MYNRNTSNLTRCQKQIYLTNTFRKLWEEHVMWTRAFIISTASNSGDLSSVTERLLRNPKDFAEVLSRYYGYNKAKSFENLLTDHLLIAAKLVNAAKAGDTKSVEENREKWYQNADMIAAFLSSINPYWKKSEWQDLLYSHLKMTESEATNRLTAQYAADINDYDEIENEALIMADYMAEGIRRQFNI